MPIVEVGDQDIEFPDSMSMDQIKAVLDEKFGPNESISNNDQDNISSSVGRGGRSGDSCLCLS